MIDWLDRLLDRVTTYRLLLYYLIALLVVATILAAAHQLSFSPLSLVLSALILTAICWAANTLLAAMLKVDTNVESAYLTALILALIISPITAPSDVAFLAWAGVLAMASKYLLVWRRQHIFNPAAIAVVITAFGLSQAASWWVGTTAMLPAVIVGGLLVARRIKRFELIVSFLVVALVGEAVINVVTGTSLAMGARQILLQSPAFFLAFVMLTEPATMPPTRWLRDGYGGLVGLLFLPQMHVGSIFSTPELALTVGNLVGYAASPRTRYKLILDSTSKLATEVSEFTFTPERGLKFSPGQYLEVTYRHPHTDSRGNRRFFTIASSPTEPKLRLGVKFYPRGSSFKRSLKQMQPGATIDVAHVAGDFTLPRNPTAKLALIAGGIGVTPYRSIVKYLIDTQQKRDIVVLYAANQADELAYTKLFEQAQQQLDAKLVYVLAQASKLTAGGEVGMIDGALIKRQLPDFAERIFYISGPPPMVSGVKRTLRGLGVPGRRIKTDFFPGYEG